MDPISKSAVEIRLDPSNWPEDLPTNEIHALPARRAIEEAREVFAQFERVFHQNASNHHLTPAGRQAANAEWAAKNLPRLEAKIAKVRESAAGIETTFGKKLRDEFLDPLVESDSRVLIQEIRAREIRGWICSLPADQRATRVWALAERGDLSALRATLSVEPYLRRDLPHLQTVGRQTHQRSGQHAVDRGPGKAADEVADRKV